MKQKNKDIIDPKEREEELHEDATKTQPENEMNEKMDKLTGDESRLSDKPLDNNESEPVVEEVGIQNEMEGLRQKYEELNDSYLRLHAEFDNFRKRTLKEKTELIKNGGERVLIGIVTLVDDFERALESLDRAEDRKSMLEGIELIYSKFINFLKQHGVNEIEAVGQPFDADRFEAVTTTPVQDESQKGKVVDCIQKGYELNEKIIRFPKVIVGE